MISWMARPFLIKTIPFGSDITMFSTFGTLDLPKMFFSQSHIRDLFQRFTGYRCDVKIKIMIRGSKFHYGTFVVAAIPNPALFVEAWVKHPFNLVQYRHEIIHVNDSEQREFVLPFLHNQDFVTILDINYHSNYQLVFSCIAPIPESIGTPASILVYGSLENVRFTTPIDPPIPINDFMLAPKVDVETSFNSIFSNELAPLIPLGTVDYTPFSGVTGWDIQAESASMGMLLAAKVAKEELDYVTNPTSSVVIDRMRQVGWMTGSIQQETQPVYLSATSRGNNSNESTTFAMSDMSESLESRMFQPHLIDVLTWNESQGTTPFGSIPVTPTLHRVSNNTMSGAFMRFNTPLTWVSRMYMRWRGSLKFSFTIVASAFHTSQLEVRWSPTDTLNTGNSAIAFYLAQDIEGPTQFEYEVPYRSVTKYLSIGSPNGFIQIRPLSDIVYPKQCCDVIPPMYILISIQAMGDFEFLSPSPNGLELGYPTNIMYGMYNLAQSSWYQGYTDTSLNQVRVSVGVPSNVNYDYLELVPTTEPDKYLRIAFVRRSIIGLIYSSGYVPVLIEVVHTLGAIVVDSTPLWPPKDIVPSLLEFAIYAPYSTNLVYSAKINTAKTGYDITSLNGTISALSVLLDYPSPSFVGSPVIFVDTKGVDFTIRSVGQVRTRQILRTCRVTTNKGTIIPSVTFTTDSLPFMSSIIAITNLWTPKTRMLGKTIPDVFEKYNGLFDSNVNRLEYFSHSVPAVASYENAMFFPTKKAFIYRLSIVDSFIYTPIYGALTTPLLDVGDIPTIPVEDIGETDEPVDNIKIDDSLVDKPVDDQDINNGASGADVDIVPPGTSEFYKFPVTASEYPFEISTTFATYEWIDEDDGTKSLLLIDVVNQQGKLGFVRLHNFYKKQGFWYLTDPMPSWMLPFSPATTWPYYSSSENKFLFLANISVPFSFIQYLYANTGKTFICEDATLFPNKNQSLFFLRTPYSIDSEMLGAMFSDGTLGFVYKITLAGIKLRYEYIMPTRLTNLSTSFWSPTTDGISYPKEMYNYLDADVGPVYLRTIGFNQDVNELYGIHFIKNNVGLWDTEVQLTYSLQNGAYVKKSHDVPNQDPSWLETAGSIIGSIFDFINGALENEDLESETAKDYVGDTSFNESDFWNKYPDRPFGRMYHELALAPSNPQYVVRKLDSSYIFPSMYGYTLFLKAGSYYLKKINADTTVPITYNSTTKNITFGSQTFSTASTTIILFKYVTTTLHALQITPTNNLPVVGTVTDYWFVPMIRYLKFDVAFVDEFCSVVPYFYFAVNHRSLSLKHIYYTIPDAQNFRTFIASTISTDKLAIYAGVLNSTNDTVQGRIRTFYLNDTTGTIITHLGIRTLSYTIDKRIGIVANKILVTTPDLMYQITNYDINPIVDTRVQTPAVVTDGLPYDSSLITQTKPKINEFYYKSKANTNENVTIVYSDTTKKFTSDGTSNTWFNYVLNEVQVLMTVNMHNTNVYYYCKPSTSCYAFYGNKSSNDGNYFSTKTYPDFSASLSLTHRSTRTTNIVYTVPQSTSLYLYLTTLGLVPALHPLPIIYLEAGQLKPNIMIYTTLFVTDLSLLTSIVVYESGTLSATYTLVDNSWQLVTAQAAEDVLWITPTRLTHIPTVSGSVIGAEINITPNILAPYARLERYNMRPTTFLNWVRALYYYSRGDVRVQIISSQEAILTLTAIPFTSVFTSSTFLSKIRDGVLSYLSAGGGMLTTNYPTYTVNTASTIADVILPYYSDQHATPNLFFSNENLNATATSLNLYQLGAVSGVFTAYVSATQNTQHFVARCAPPTLIYTSTFWEVTNKLFLDSPRWGFLQVLFAFTRAPTTITVRKIASIWDKLSKILGIANEYGASHSAIVYGRYAM